MPKGVNISKEKRLEVWKLIVIDNMDPEEIFHGDLFRGDVNIISLARLRDLQTMFFNDEIKTTEYLTASLRRGNPGFDSFDILDFIMAELVRAYPLNTVEFYRAQLIILRGIDTFFTQMSS